MGKPLGGILGFQVHFVQGGGVAGARSQSCDDLLTAQPECQIYARGCNRPALSAVSAPAMPPNTRLQPTAFGAQDRCYFGRSFSPEPHLSL